MFSIKKMPLLEYVKSFHSSVSLSNVLLIGCQHILETTHTMLRSLYDFGLNPKNIFLVGKCYSSNRSVWQEMHRDGIQVSFLSFSFESHLTFDDQFYSILDQFLKDILYKVDLSKFHRIILIDDGGQFLTISMKIFKNHKNIIGIEQTTSGYEKIKFSPLPFPVVNVARSQVKLIYESPMIADTVIKKILKRMTVLKGNLKQILVMGAGAIGSSIYTVLKNDYRVQVYDKKEGINLENHLQAADMIIGCTGEISIPFSKYKYIKKGCVLVSASSSDREFDAVHIRRKCKNIKSCHTDIEGERLILLNCGFPINFDGDKNSVAPEKIQLTRALLLAAILQAYEMPNNSLGIVPLDIDMQREIISKYLNIQKLNNMEEIVENGQSYFDKNK
jgi:S-adenosylhomocysteine hydrolase